MGTLGTHRTRSRWLPGADSLVGQHSPFGFSTCPDTWLPMPPEWAALTAEKQRADAGSTLSFFDLHSDYVGNEMNSTATSTGWPRPTMR